MEKNEKKKEEGYKLLPVIKRLIKEIFAEYPIQRTCVIAYTIVAGIYPLFAVILPKLAIGTIERNSVDVVKELIIIMTVYAVVVSVFGLFKNVFRQKIEAINMRSRVINLCKVFTKLMKMDYCYVEDSSFWEKNDRAINAFNGDADGMEGMLNKLCIMPSNILAIVAMIVITCMLNPLILLALLVHVVVLMWAAKSDHDFRYARKEEIAKARRKIAYYEKTSRDFTFGKDIRIYNLKDRILGNYHAEVKAYKNLINKMAKHEYLTSLAGVATLFISDVLMYGILVKKAVEGMPISSFTSYITLITALMAAMVEFGNDLSFLRNEGQYMNDAYKLIDEKLEDTSKKKIVFAKDEQIGIVFEHVDFKYPGTEKYIYKDLNFTIHKGERLAIVGVNGAGKSTLVKLMMGLFAPTAGHIYINGIDVNDFNKQDLYNIFSAVFQDVNVMAFSIRENVTGSSTDSDDDRVCEALKNVGLLDKVNGFEKGLDQMMLKIIDENGTDFSGGERQKLSISRGLYKDAQIVVMDEPTAALDALAEASIYENFSDMVKGKTAVYISHRLASTKFCDKIALFDKTGLIEYGTHDELMAAKGEYYRMFVIQGKYYQIDDEEDEDMKRIILDSMASEEVIA